MSNISAEPNLIPLLHGLKPYLRQNGQVFADGILSLLQLLSSSHGQEAVVNISKVFSTSGKGDKMISLNTSKGLVALSTSTVFSLFLILILLLLSGNLLAFNPNPPEAPPSQNVLPLK
jgi:hypothetical protein